MRNEVTILTRYCERTSFVVLSWAYMYCRLSSIIDDVARKMVRNGHGACLERLLLTREVDDNIIIGAV